MQRESSMAFPPGFSLYQRETKSAHHRTPHSADYHFLNSRIKNSSSEFRMAAEALHRHFQTHKRYRPRDEFDVTGDFTKTKPLSSRKTNVYVHEFLNVGHNPVNCESHQNQLHRNLYSHENGHKSERIKSRSFQDSFSSSSHKYVESPSHTFSNPKTAQAVLKNRNTIMKLEESYWANWRPNKSEKKTSKAHYRVIRKPLPLPEKINDSASGEEAEDEDEKEEETNIKEEKVEEPEQVEEAKEENVEEPAVKDNDEVQAKKSEEIQVPADLSENDLVPPTEGEDQEKQPTKEETDDVTPLKHTDSFILNAKRQSEEKPHFQQPRCIKLFRKPTVATSGAVLVKGGSYPLKPTLKKEKSMIKGNLRLGRPGSPIMVHANRGRKAI